MARKKAVEEPVIKQGGGAVTEPELVDVTHVIPAINKTGETQELVWVETVDQLGRHMIQVPKEG